MEANRRGDFKEGVISQVRCSDRSGKMRTGPGAEVTSDVDTSSAMERERQRTEMGLRGCGDSKYHKLFRVGEAG